MERRGDPASQEWIAGLRARRFMRPSSKAAAWSIRAGSFALILFLMSGAGHRFGAIETEPFLWLLAIIGFLGVVSLGSSISGLASFWETGAAGGRRSVFGGLLALVVLAPFALSGWRIAIFPRLNDITTDLVDPPQLRLASQRSGIRYSNEPLDEATAELIVDHYPEVNGRRYPASPERVLEVVLSLIEERGWKVVSQNRSVRPGVDTTVEGEAFSYFLGFPSDIAIRLTDEGPSTYVDMRSASRYGRHDLGDNAKRITRFLADLDVRITELSLP